MKKAFDWLNSQGLPHDFHDYKKLGISPEQLSAWAAQLGWQTLLNTRGTTWRSLSDIERQNLDEVHAIALMCAKPSLIRRPVITLDDKVVLVGFDASLYAEQLRA